MKVKKVKKEASQQISIRLKPHIIEQLYQLAFDDEVFPGQLVAKLVADETERRSKQSA